MMEQGNIRLEILLVCRSEEEQGFGPLLANWRCRSLVALIGNSGIDELA